MAGKVTNAHRNIIVAEFRRKLCERLGVTPYVHQATWWAASEGLVLTDQLDPAGTAVQLPDKTVELRRTVPRPNGPARVIADLGAYKIGKSYGAALWAAAFAAVPDARVSLVGIEYDICAPEFTYICDFLLSDSGMGMSNMIVSMQNRPRDGRMFLDLKNGARFEAKSWERKDSLKGKEIDAYIFCEAYMLPGIECFTANSQNLRAREGYAVFPTTPDRPWLEELHRNAHSGEVEFKDWHCTCGVDASVNPHTYDAAARQRDKLLMTREKFAIHYEGKLGDYVGRVFPYQRGERTFSVGTHPQMFKPNSAGLREDLKLPEGWEIVGAVDTGTFYTGILVAFSPSGDAFVIDEFPNYSYAGGQPDRDEGVTIPAWSHRLKERSAEVGGSFHFWADKNSQFKKELRAYDVHLMPSSLPLEARTEITREYFQHNRIFLAPWLQILPFELENAAWPDETTAAGKFSRVKDRDHTLDCLEHVLSRRPRGKVLTKANVSKTWIEGYLGRAPSSYRAVDPHLGGL